MRICTVVTVALLSGCHPVAVSSKSTLGTRSNGGSIVLAKDASGAIGIWTDVALQSDADATLATYKKITATIVPGKILLELAPESSAHWCLATEKAQRVKIRLFRDGGALDWESTWVDVPVARSHPEPVRLEVRVPASLEDSVQAELAWDHEAWTPCD